MQADILRKKFLDYFKSRKHRIVESDFLVPKDDPTVLFTPAGMNQFKKEFLGVLSGFSRAATSQRCLRTDDLDKVGKTPCHHTFFEMLGNFSFGDYFKKEAISWAWEFLTEELKISKDKLWVSVYKDDDEAYKIWSEVIKVAPSRIIKLGDKDNFWPSEAKTKGPNGPCGPCSEIFYDLGKTASCNNNNCDPACECGRFTEIWNLVFTQFNRKENGALVPLPKKNIDTGMGLERLTAVMQGAKNNFETDLFAPLLKEISDVATKQNIQPRYAVADHIRAITFAIYDGVMPSNEGRGYVVRKLIRRASLHMQALGVKKPFLYKLVAAVAQIMRTPYPELESRKENISQIVLAEEQGFIQTLNTSDMLFKEKFLKLMNNKDPKMVGEAAFQLYDTYGMPLDLTLAWLEKNSIDISQEAFQRKLDEQKDRSKTQSAMKGDVFSASGIDYGKKETLFLGYKAVEAKAKVLKLFKGNSEVKKISTGENASIVLDKTVFYPAGGGQVADTGEIVKGKNIFSVTDTKKCCKAVVHTGTVKSGSFKTGDLALAKIDTRRRMAIARNHTATHLLQAALRKVLGGHVRQQGSLVDENRLRFDFAHFKDVNNHELLRIEELVNEVILQDKAVVKKEMTLQAAKKSGALAFFGEKYGGKVRVVSVADVSKEFCGGTHLDSTAPIGIFKIVSEGSVASGIRRIEAVTGEAAYKRLKEQDSLLEEACASLNTSPQKLLEELARKEAHLKDLEKKLSAQKLDLVKQGADDLIDKAQIIKDVKVITEIIENLDMDLLRKNIDLIKTKVDNTVIALASASSGRALLVLGVTPDLCAKGIDAGKLIREVAVVIGGCGGGRPDFAQAGGSKPENLNAAFTKLKELI